MTMVSDDGGGSRAVEEGSVTAVLQWGVVWCHCGCIVVQSVERSGSAHVVQLRSKIALAVTSQRGMSMSLRERFVWDSILTMEGGRQSSPGMGVAQNLGC